MKLLLENWRDYLNEAVMRVGAPIHIFFDMDGVLVDFAGTISTHINKNLPIDSMEAHPDSKSKRKALRRLQQFGTANVSPEQIENITKKKDTNAERNPREMAISKYLLVLLVNNPQIWLDMEKAEGADEMISIAKQIGNIYILSSPVDESSVNAKHQWINKHYPNIFKEVFILKDKGVVFDSIEIQDRKNAILIDDRIKNVNRFEEVGGVVIYHNPPATAQAVATTINALKAL